MIRNIKGVELNTNILTTVLIKLNANMKIIVINVKRVELNIKIVSAVLIT